MCSGVPLKHIGYCYMEKLSDKKWECVQSILRDRGMAQSVPIHQEDKALSGVAWSFWGVCGHFVALVEAWLPQTAGGGATEHLSVSSVLCPSPRGRQDPAGPLYFNEVAAPFLPPPEGGQKEQHEQRQLRKAD